MAERLDYVSINARAIASMAKADMSTIDPKFRALIELRVSQINGCVYCVDLHTREARSAGETQQRLDCLVVWRESQIFKAQERAALAWAEALTRVSEAGTPHPLYEAVLAHFTPEEVVDLTLIIAQMNAWNRLAIGFAHKPETQIG